MLKRRPVIAVSPRLPHRDGLVTVVPLSQSGPARSVSYQIEIKLAEPLPHPFPDNAFWVKADTIATVAFDRLDLFRTARDQYGKRKYLQPKISKEQLTQVHSAILHSLGLGALTNNL